MGWIFGQLFLFLFLVLAKFADEHPDDLTPEERRKRSKGIWITGAGILILVGLFLLYFLVEH